MGTASFPLRNIENMPLLKFSFVKAHDMECQKTKLACDKRKNLVCILLQYVTDLFVSFHYLDWEKVYMMQNGQIYSRIFYSSIS